MNTWTRKLIDLYTGLLEREGYASKAIFADRNSSNGTRVAANPAKEQHRRRVISELEAAAFPRVPIGARLA
jgi:hypothetical protein